VAVLQALTILSTTKKNLSTILLSRLTPYADDVIEGYQCGFPRIRSPSDRIFYILRILE
jgi:hypothetical protein